MPAGSRKIRLAFVLQAAVASLVVLVCMLLLLRWGRGASFELSILLLIGVALMAIMGGAWAAYRAIRRTLVPVNWLLGRVSRWDPHQPDTQSLAPAEIPAEVQGPTRLLAEAIHELGQRLQAFVRREQEFTRDASHELRTPLTVTKVAADLIAEDPGLSERSRRSLSRIQQENASMSALVDALLLLARDPTVPLETEDFAVYEVMEAELERFRPHLQAKDLALEWACDAMPSIHGPPRAFTVMLRTLLSNALRFTQAGSVSVRLYADRIEVVDTGIGMEASVLARVYEPFFRASLDSDSGHGLGLPIAQRLSERCGWPLRIESEVGAGTRATILFGDAVIPD